MSEFSEKTDGPLQDNKSTDLPEPDNNIFIVSILKKSWKRISGLHRLGGHRPAETRLPTHLLEFTVASFRPEYFAIDLSLCAGESICLID